MVFTLIIVYLYVRIVSLILSSIYHRRLSWRNIPIYLLSQQSKRVRKHTIEYIFYACLFTSFLAFPTWAIPDFCIFMIVIKSEVAFNKVDSQPQVSQFYIANASLFHTVILYYKVKNLKISHPQIFYLEVIFMNLKGGILIWLNLQIPILREKSFFTTQFKIFPLFRKKYLS